MAIKRKSPANIETDVLAQMGPPPSLTVKIPTATLKSQPKGIRVKIPKAPKAKKAKKAMKAKKVKKVAPLVIKKKPSPKAANKKTNVVVVEQQHDAKTLSSIEEEEKEKKEKESNVPTIITNSRATVRDMSTQQVTFIKDQFVLGNKDCIDKMKRRMTVARIVSHRGQEQCPFYAQHCACHFYDGVQSSLNRTLTDMTRKPLQDLKSSIKYDSSPSIYRG